MIAKIANGLYCKTSARPSRMEQYRAWLKKQAAVEAPKQPASTSPRTRSEALRKLIALTEGK